MNVLEYSGAEKTSPLVTDIAGTEGSFPGTWSSSPFNAAGELIVMGIVTANGGAYTAGPGFKIKDAYQTTASTSFRRDGPGYCCRANGDDRDRYLARHAAGYRVGSDVQAGGEMNPLTPGIS